MGDNGVEGGGCVIRGCVVRECVCVERGGGGDALEGVVRGERDRQAAAMMMSRLV